MRLSAETPRLALDQVAVPEVGPGNVLVHVDHVAQNPTDGKSMSCAHLLWAPMTHLSVVQSFDSNAFGDGTVLGCDFTGVVRKVGDGVTRLKEGDNIAGLIWGGKDKQARFLHLSTFDLTLHRREERARRLFAVHNCG